MFILAPVSAAVLLALASAHVFAQSSSDTAGTLSTVQVNASADASAEGLSKPYAGGQVARGGRAGILGTKDNMDTPFSITSYTNELIQDRQAKSVGEVLQSDPTVRVARGFGNFQESYFIRGFLLSSDDVGYNGMYSLLPRQYIATELFERVEILRGASTFLNGANPGGGGIGGSINLVPKRAPNEPLNRITVGTGSGGANTLSADIARRFGPDNATGIRINAATRSGGTAVDNENSKLGLLSAAVDWHSRDVRLSGDIGWQENKLKQTRTNVDISALTSVPAAPDNTTNWAQPGSYSNERDLFGTLRGEFDINDKLTAWAALGARRSSEANSLANLALTSASGAGTTYRFDNTRKDNVLDGEAGLRGKFQTGSVGHEWVVSASSFKLDKKAAYAMDFFNQQSTNLYNPVATQLPAISASAFTGNTLASPALTGRTKMTSLALGDTLSLLGGSTLLTLGARHQTLEVDNYDYGTGALSSNYDKSRVSPMAGVVYKLSKQYSLYANYVEGLTQGSTAPSTAVNKGDTLSPYVSKQKEIGVKWDSGRFGGTLALFDTTRPRDFLNTSTNVFSASGEDRHQGVELTVQGEATRSLRLLGGLTLLNAEQKSTGSATTDGKQVIGVPKRQANLGAEWDVPGVSGLALDGRVVYTGASYADAVNTLKVSGWTRLDAGARYLTEVQGKLVTLRLRVENLANKNYWASVGGYSGYGYLVAGAPRSLNLSASFDF
ncbi:TonB-dependent receptor [Rhodoferax sp.]|uniref:TonB-dependent receptor n=1 Tax=Rhodoferax sp. TaxID=50421 RepID=UPI00374DE23A